MLRDVVNHLGGNIGMIGAEAAESARDRSPSERQAHRTQIDRLTNNEATQGDFTTEEERDLAVAAAAATVLFGPEAGAIVEGVAHLGELAVSLFHSIFG
jgi:hypothetical protein